VNNYQKTSARTSFPRQPGNRKAKPVSQDLNEARQHSAGLLVYLSASVDYGSVAYEQFDDVALSPTRSQVQRGFRAYGGRVGVTSTL